MDEQDRYQRVGIQLLTLSMWCQVQTRRPDKTFTFFTNFQNSNCYCHIWLQSECIQMSTKDPCIGLAVLEIALWILRKVVKISIFVTLRLNMQKHEPSKTIYVCTAETNPRRVTGPLLTALNQGLIDNLLYLIEQGNYDSCFNVYWENQVKTSQ